MRRDGFLAYNVRVNLRWVLRPVCGMRGHHEWQTVHSIHPLMGSGFRYCRLCGWGWRTEGREHTARFCRHRFEKDGQPSMDRGQPFRQIERCPGCGSVRCVDCATGKVVA